MAHETTRPKKSSEDVFDAWLFEGATYTEEYDLPVLPAAHCRPERMITFSEARNERRDDVGAAVCFYEHDQVFRPFLKDPGKYLPNLKEHPCVVMPDCSAYWDMPYWKRGHSVLMNYGYAWWMCRHGLTVVPNARPCLPLPPESTLGGIAKRSTIAIGEHGNLKLKANRRRFVEGVRVVIDFLEPENILVFGADCYGAFDYAREKGVELDFFEPRIACKHAGGDCCGR